MPTTASLVEPGIIDERTLIATLIGDNVGILTNGTTSVNRNSAQSNSLRRRGTRRLSGISIAQLSSLVVRKSSASPANTRESEVRYDERISELELANDVYRSILDQERKKLRSLSVKLELQQQIINMQNQEKELAELRLQRMYLQHSTQEHARKQQSQLPIPVIPEPAGYKETPLSPENGMKVYGRNQNTVNLTTIRTDESAKLPLEKSIMMLFDGSDEEPDRRPVKYSTQAKRTDDVFCSSDNRSSGQNTLLDSSFAEPAQKIIKYSTESVSCYLLDEACDKCKEKKNKEESGVKSYSANANNRHSAIIGNHLLEVDTARNNFFKNEVSEIDLLQNLSVHEQQIDSPQGHTQPVYQSICKVRYIASAISKSSTGSITRAQPSVNAPTVSCRVGRTFNTPLGGLRESASPSSATDASSYWSPIYSGPQVGSSLRSTINKDAKGRTRPVILGRSSVSAYQV